MGSTSNSGEPSIEKEPYYHGLLPRDDVRGMLKENGDFVIRVSEPKAGEPRSHILSVLVDKHSEELSSLRHCVILTDNQKFWIDKASFDSIHALIDYYLSPAGHKDDSLVRIHRAVTRQSWELDHESITIQKKLGEGAFGEVSMGVFKSRKTGKSVQVAVKQAKLEKMGKEQIKEFMSEARFLRGLNHPNVVKFYGVAVLQEPLYMVMELATCGALDSYLQKNPHLPLETRNEMILQAAWGVEYLHAKHILHRDIAARNCLYGDQKVKISDFGLSRSGLQYQMGPSKKVPIRWLAVETLVSCIYTQKTDVWAYGVMCWEIFSGGAEPYTGCNPVEVNQKVRAGHRLAVPSIASHEVKAMMQSCWLENPSDRPHMCDVAVSLQKVTGIPRPHLTSAEHGSKESDHKNNARKKPSSTGKKKSHNPK